MKLTFRWYGQSDPIPLQYVRQIPGMSGVVSAVYDVPVGEVWPHESIAAIKTTAAANNLEFEVVESVPVHEDIKLGKPSRNALIENFCENVRRLSKTGIKVVCYNFMPVFDWFRSDLARTLPDGSTTLAYDAAAVQHMDMASNEVSLPGWDESYSKAELNALLAEYSNVDKNRLWENYAYFLHKVIPVCEKTGMKLAVHPDDPPWDIFGLPRIITGAESYAKLKEIEPSPLNGITLCLGSLGANPANRISAIAREYADRIHFVHARNVKWMGDSSFEEAPHPSSCGCLDMYGILKSLHDVGFDGYIRPDHGRMIWGETGKPGYGLYDRALGATYVLGLWEAIERAAEQNGDRE